MPFLDLKKGARKKPLKTFGNACIKTDILSDLDNVELKIIYYHRSLFYNFKYTLE